MAHKDRLKASGEIPQPTKKNRMLRLLHQLQHKDSIGDSDDNSHDDDYNSINNKKKSIQGDSMHGRLRVQVTDSVILPGEDHTNDGTANFVNKRSLLHSSSSTRHLMHSTSGGSLDKLVATTAAVDKNNSTHQSINSRASGSTALGVGEESDTHNTEEIKFIDTSTTDGSGRNKNSNTMLKRSLSQSTNSDCNDTRQYRLVQTVKVRMLFPISMQLRNANGIFPAKPDIPKI
jgi:hypothetical protein